MQSILHGSRRALVCLLLGAVVLGVSGVGFADTTSKPFVGAKANTGTVTLATKDGVRMLTLSTDFVPPDTPDPHWQVVDSKGTTYLLDRLLVKPDKTLRKTIALPKYVGDVAAVQIWCAWAEALLGEASFEGTMKTTMK